jgi:hypothetical protein
MSQVGLWNSTLTADEVSSLYNHGLPIDLTTDQAAYSSSSNLVGYWRMGSGTLDTYPLIADQTNATLTDIITSDFSSGVDGFNAFGLGEIAGNISVGGEDNSLRYTVTASVGDTRAFEKDSALVVGKTYEIKFKYYIPSSNTNLTSIGTDNNIETVTDSWTEFTEYSVATRTDFRIFVGDGNNYMSPATTGDVGYIKNVSVKQVQGNPAIMTNQTSSDIENGSPYANIVQNGTFDTDSDWTKGTGWTIAGGIASQSGGVGQLSQTISTTVGVDCKITFTANVTAGAIRIAAGPSAAIADFTTSGTYTLIVPFLGNTTLYILGSSASFIGSIDNVTVEEVNTGLQGYWKMGDGTNDEYPVIYDQTNPTLGSELVVNGDFATDSDWDKTGTWSIESNYATASGNSTSQYIQQDFTITNGKTYLFTYEIIENTLNGNGSSLSGSGGFVSVTLSSVIGTHQVYITADDSGAAYALKIGVSGTATTGTIKLDNVSVKEVQGNPAVMTNMLEGNITNQYPLTKIRNYYRMGDGILYKTKQVLILHIYLLQI